MDLITRRRALMTRIESEGQLPSEYQKIEYVQSNYGGEYIDMLYPGNMGISADVRFNMINASNAPGIFGNRIGSNRFALVRYLGGFDLAINGDNTVGTWNLDHIYNAKFASYSNKTSTLIVTDDFGYSVSTSTNAKANNNINMYLFHYNYGGSVDTQQSTTRIYYFKLYDVIDENEVLVRDFVPCYRKADREIGMYDFVTKAFFTNAGTGSFIAGPKI